MTTQSRTLKNKHYKILARLWREFNYHLLWVNCSVCINKEKDYMPKWTYKHLPFAICHLLFRSLFWQIWIFSKTNQIMCVYMNKSNCTTERLKHCIGCFSHVFGMYLIRVGTTFRIANNAPLLGFRLSRNKSKWEMQLSGSPTGGHGRSISPRALMMLTKRRADDKRRCTYNLYRSVKCLLYHPMKTPCCNNIMFTYSKR